MIIQIIPLNNKYYQFLIIYASPYSGKVIHKEFCRNKEEVCELLG